MAEILDGAASPAQISAFVVALRMKGETVPELVGMVEAMLDASTRVEIDLGQPVIDVVGTGGDRAHTINVSTLAAIVVAGAGGQVCKHGNRAASSACGAADLLEALGVAIELGPDGVAACVREAGMGFCFAPRYHPAMRHAGPSRRDLGIPTAFNILGPLSNPARVRRYLIGVADLRMAERMAGVLEARGAERALIVHGGDGLDELTTTGPSNVVELRDGAITTWTVDPDGPRHPTRRPGGPRGRRCHGQRRPGPPGAGRRARSAPRHRQPQRGGGPAGGRVWSTTSRPGSPVPTTALDAGAAVAALARLTEVSQREAQQEAGQPG